MPSNIEIKAKVKDLNRLRSAVMEIATGPCQVLHQEDVFFHVRRGRLKLRIFTNDFGELIYYERPDSTGPKRSNYQIYSTSKPLELRRLLAAALGETITVKKKRELYMVGQTRIHLDEVGQLGTFMEIEVVLGPEQSPEDGKRIAYALMEKLGINKSDLVSCAYADLLLVKAESGSR